MNATCAISPTAETAAAAVAAVPRRVTRLTATSNIMTTRPRKSTGATLRTSITDVMSSAVKDPESAWSHGRYRLISASASPAVATSAPIWLVRWGTTFLRSCARVGRADRCGAGAEEGMARIGRASCRERGQGAEAGGEGRKTKDAL